MFVDAAATAAATALLATGNVAGNRTLIADSHGAAIVINGTTMVRRPISRERSTVDRQRTARDINCAAVRGSVIRQRAVSDRHRTAALIDGTATLAAAVAFKAATAGDDQVARIFNGASRDALSSTRFTADRVNVPALLMPPPSPDPEPLIIRKSFSVAVRPGPT